jgi:hypothetical protein
MSRSALALLPLLLAVNPCPSQSQEHYTLGPISRIILVQNYSVQLKTTAEGPQETRSELPR